MPAELFNKFPPYTAQLDGGGLPLNVSSLALEASHVVKSGPGVLYGFTVYSDKASAQFVQLHDVQGGVPADGVIPVFCISVAATSDREFVWLPPRYFGAGIVICNSSTAATKTLGSADCFFDVQYL